jgi:predicted nucleic acid-binding protein
MRFWDSSAIVPLVASESVSASALELYRKDHEILVWMFTITEVTSALCRKLRDGSLSREAFRRIRVELRELSGDWSEVTAVEPVCRRANRLLEIHPLSAADALQLGAALIATADDPRGFSFVTYDRTLALAAEKEGFSVQDAQS